MRSGIVAVLHRKDGEMETMPGACGVGDSLTALGKCAVKKLGGVGGVNDSFVGQCGQLLIDDRQL
jgi:hypothetical protein